MCIQVRKVESLPADTKKSDKISLVQTAELLSEDIETLKRYFWGVARTNGGKAITERVAKKIELRLKAIFAKCSFDA